MLACDTARTIEGKAACKKIINTARGEKEKREEEFH